MINDFELSRKLRRIPTRAYAKAARLVEGCATDMCNYYRDTGNIPLQGIRRHVILRMEKILAGEEEDPDPRLVAS
jgi:hypothetical protein